MYLLDRLYHYLNPSSNPHFEDQLSAIGLIIYLDLLMYNRTDLITLFEKFIMQIGGNTMYQIIKAYKGEVLGYNQYLMINVGKNINLSTLKTLHFHMNKIITNEEKKLHGRIASFYTFVGAGIFETDKKEVIDYFEKNCLSIIQNYNPIYEIEMYLVSGNKKYYNKINPNDPIFQTLYIYATGDKKFIQDHINIFSKQKVYQNYNEAHNNGLLYVIHSNNISILELFLSNMEYNRKDAIDILYNTLRYALTWGTNIKIINLLRYKLQELEYL